MIILDLVLTRTIAVAFFIRRMANVIMSSIIHEIAFIVLAVVAAPMSSSRLRCLDVVVVLDLSLTMLMEGWW